MRLGDYIHFHYNSYKQNGLRPKGGAHPDKPVNIAKAHQEQLKSLVPDIPYLTLKDLERKLNFFYGDSKSNKNGPSLTEKQRAQLQDILYQYLAKHSKNIKDYKIDFSDLSAIRVMTDDMTPVKSKGNSKNLTGQKFTWASAVMSRLEKLRKLTNQIDGAGDLLQTLNQYEKDYNEILKKIETEWSASNKQISQSSVEAFYKQENINETFKFNNFIDRLNEMLNQIVVLISTQILGDLGEAVTAVMPEVYQAALNGSVDECFKSLVQTLEKNVVGKQRSAKIIDETKVLGARNTNKLNKKGKNVEKLQIGAFGIETNLTYTQDKIDVMLNVNGGSPIAASVKNISAKSDSINILSGASLLKYLQLYPVFGNHYLNITANLRSDENGKSLGGAAKAPARDVAVMHNALLSTLGTHALIGGLLSKKSGGSGIYKAGTAEVLVVNTHGNGKGRFRVYAMSKLLDNIERNIKVSGSITNTPKEWHNQFLSANTGKTRFQAAYARCIIILQELHAAKIQVSLLTKGLK